MFNGITEEKLKKLGIYDLRRIARLCGVNSPTSKRRDVLITEILRIKAGEQRPVFNKKIGRPVKSMGEEDDFGMNFAVNGDKELKMYLQPEKNDENLFVFDQDFDEENMPLSTNTIEFKGILRKTSQDNYFVINIISVKQKNVVLIDASVVKEHKLIEGDILHGTATLYVSKGYAKMKELSEINGVVPSKNHYSLDYDPVIPNVILEQPDFKAGQSRVVICENLNDQISYIEKHTKKYTQMGYKCIVVGVEITIETKLKLDMIENLTQITSLLDEQTQFSFEKINDLLYHSGSLFYHKNNVVVFVLDTLNLFSVLDAYYQAKQGANSEKTTLCIRKLVANSKASKTSSISTICLLSQDDVELRPAEVKMLQKYSMS